MYREYESEETIKLTAAAPVHPLSTPAEAWIIPPPNVAAFSVNVFASFAVYAPRLAPVTIAGVVIRLSFVETIPPMIGLAVKRSIPVGALRPHVHLFGFAYVSAARSDARSTISVTRTCEGQASRDRFDIPIRLH